MKDDKRFDGLPCILVSLRPPVVSYVSSNVSACASHAWTDEAYRSFNIPIRSTVVAISSFYFYYTMGSVVARPSSR
jgi:hypothetical protein